MPWVDVAEQNPWLSSDDEGTPVLCVSSGPVVVNTAPTIKEEPRGVVVLEIASSSSFSSSPSPSLKAEDNEGQDDIPELPVTGPLPAPIAVPDGRSTSSHPSPSNSHINTPAVVNGGEGSYKEEVHHGSPSTAHAAVHNSSASVAAASEVKRRTSSESLSPAPTEDADIDDDEDGAELKGPVRDPPCFLCVTKVTLRGKGDSVCHHPAIIRHGRWACVGCRKYGKRCESSPDLVVQAWKAWKAEPRATVAAERALKALRTICAACRNLRQLVKMGMIPSATVETLLSGGDLYPEIDEGSSLPGVPSRAEFTALKRRVKSVEASLQRQNVLRRHPEPRKRRAGRGNSDQVKKDDKGPELPDSEDEESYEEEETEDEWLP
ncbi:uncharacterized protein B0T23DRAFT_163570 [Neurospora hispaniola]|uniref:Uncharacterized protein n=1 Tax=Neurospora hispaniola TaxID=588809 RepID=A0AAJ0MQ54_9PEZI|nr:hypothetical protein B0T23DRAFT_163570 [Neurospora hispaniola]